MATGCASILVHDGGEFGWSPVTVSQFGEKRGVFLLSLGLAAGIHGAALAYALVVYQPEAKSERQEEVVTVELVDASMLPDESEPAPPTDKLPSAAAHAAQLMASAAPEITAADATSEPETSAPQAAMAPELGETEPRRGMETAAISPSVEPVPEIQMSEVPPAASAMPAAQPVTEAPLPDMAALPQMTPPPLQTSQSAPAVALEAPPDETATVALPPPLAETDPAEIPSAEAPPRNVPIVKVQPLRSAAAKRPLPKKVASLEPPKRTAAAEPKPKEKPKKKAELSKADSKSATPAKPKAKKLAALPKSGTNDASGDKAKSKSTKTGKTKTKGTTGSTSSGSGGLGSYANSVRARVARNKPAGTTARGKTVITVGLSASGGIRFTRVSQSSGNASLDRAAMIAVQRAAPFPRPPSGATSDQLVFNIPISYQ